MAKEVCFDRGRASLTDRYNILIYCPAESSEVVGVVSDRFRHSFVDGGSECVEQAGGGEFQALLIDLLSSPDATLDEYKTLLEQSAVKALPVIVLFPGAVLSHKLRAFELGCDDVLDQHADGEEVCARITKSIYNRIANEQLKNRLQAANAEASTALADKNDVQACLQFLLAANQCDNLDQLGQAFFAAAERLGASCSLQMRSIYGTKNMEANGMAKELESQLLEQLSDAGECVDFGKRTLLNGERAGVLVRNMPVGDSARCEQLKENFQALLEGLDARVRTLDMADKLHDGKRLLSDLTQGMDWLTAQLDSNYQSMVKEMVNVVEELSQTMQLRIPGLGLNEEQERFFDAVLGRCMADTHRIVGRGLNIDELCIDLWEGMDRALMDIEYVGNIAGVHGHGAGTTDNTGNVCARLRSNLSLSAPSPKRAERR